MGKTKRRKGYELPHGGVMMKEKNEKIRTQEWHEKRKEEKRLQQRMKKLKRN